MPIYLYEHPKTKEVKEIIQTMSEDHKYFEDGVEWKRIFVNPTVAIDTKIDPNNARDFVEKTKKKNMSIGNMWEESARLSEKRGGDGNDPVKQKAIDAYEKKTKKKHPSKMKQGTIEI